MFTGAQVLAHVIGDYVLQSGWMANNKTKRSLPAAVHALVYFIPFLIMFHPSFTASVIMVGTHFAIDRWRLARYVVYAKEFLAPPSEWRQWTECSQTGLSKDVPPFIAVWLMIIIDNTLHIVINALSLEYL